MVVVHGLVNLWVWLTFSRARLGQSKHHIHPWVGGSPCLVNAVARRLNDSGSWVCGGPCLVNAVARRLNGGGRDLSPNEDW
jgi:hypothetical protein